MHEGTFNRCMGPTGDGSTLWMRVHCQLWRFEEALAPGESHNYYDRLNVPQVGYITRNLDIHDVVDGWRGQRGDSGVTVDAATNEIV